MSTWSISPEKEKNSRTSRSPARSEMFRTRTVLVPLLPSCKTQPVSDRRTPKNNNDAAAARKNIKQQQQSLAHLHGAAAGERKRQTRREEGTSRGRGGQEDPREGWRVVVAWLGRVWCLARWGRFVMAWRACGCLCARRCCWLAGYFSLEQLARVRALVAEKRGRSEPKAPPTGPEAKYPFHPREAVALARGLA